MIRPCKVQWHAFFAWIRMDHAWSLHGISQQKSYSLEATPCIFLNNIVIHNFWVIESLCYSSRIWFSYGCCEEHRGLLEICGHNDVPCKTMHFPCMIHVHDELLERVSVPKFSGKYTKMSTPQTRKPSRTQLLHLITKKSPFPKRKQFCNCRGQTLPTN